MTKTELFLKLANPDRNGISRWVNVTEFVGEYAELKFGNGASWARKESTLAKKLAHKLEYEYIDRLSTSFHLLQVLEFVFQPQQHL